jgi:hypothetical protein
MTTTRTTITAALAHGTHVHYAGSLIEAHGYYKIIGGSSNRWSLQSLAPKNVHTDYLSDVSDRSIVVVHSGPFSKSDPRFAA